MSALVFGRALRQATARHLGSLCVTAPRAAVIAPRLLPGRTAGFSSAAAAGKAAKVLQAEVKHEEEQYEQSKELKAFLKNTPFTFTEADGDVNMSLSRDIGEKTVKIEWQLASPFDPNMEDEEGEPEESTNMWVTVESKSGAGLTVRARAHTDAAALKPDEQDDRINRFESDARFAVADADSGAGIAKQRQATPEHETSDGAKPHHHHHHHHHHQHHHPSSSPHHKEAAGTSKTGMHGTGSSSVVPREATGLPAAPAQAPVKTTSTNWPAHSGENVEQIGSHGLSSRSQGGESQDECRIQLTRGLATLDFPEPPQQHE